MKAKIPNVGLPGDTETISHFYELDRDDGCSFKMELGAGEVFILKKVFVEPKRNRIDFVSIAVGGKMYAKAVLHDGCAEIPEEAALLFTPFIPVTVVPMGIEYERCWVSGYVIRVISENVRPGGES